jgi:hypothetical protein
MVDAVVAENDLFPDDKKIPRYLARRVVPVVPLEIVLP